MTALSTGNHCKWLQIYDNSMVTLLLCPPSPIPLMLLSHLAKLINHPTGSQNFTTWCNDCISLSMLLIVLLALLMKISKFLQSDSGTSTSFFTHSFLFLSLIDKNVFMLAVAYLQWGPVGHVPH